MALQWTEGTAQDKRVHNLKVCCRYNKDDSFYFTAYWDHSRKLFIAINNPNQENILPAQIEFLMNTKKPRVDYKLSKYGSL